MRPRIDPRPSLGSESTEPGFGLVGLNFTTKAFLSLASTIRSGRVHSNLAVSLPSRPTHHDVLRLLCQDRGGSGIEHAT